MIIFVHIPKTGGTSLQSAMAAEFGARLLLDYDDRPLAHAGAIRKAMSLLAMLRTPDPGAYDCIYGHFMPLKYSRVADAAFVTWLRDPVQRMLSRYHHYVRASGSGRATLPAGLSPEDFCRISRFQNTYARYFWRFPLSRFDFIGITEHFADSIAVFQDRYGIACAAPDQKLNANPDLDEGRYEVEPELHRLIATTNAADVAIYEQARRRFAPTAASD